MSGPDPLDYSAICLSYRPVLLGYTLRNLTRSVADAEDLVQETLTSALAHWSEVKAIGEKPSAAIHSWLVTILRNKFINLYRRSVRAAAVPREALVEATYGVEEGASPCLGENQVSEEVQAALRSLDPKQREIVLRFAAGEKYKDIAEALGVPIGTVMSRLSRARDALTRALKRYARTEYGIRSGRARIHVIMMQPAERKEPETDRVDRVVGGDDDSELLDGQDGPDAVAAW
jgi:RNA polymerase sigma-70 factor (ECF subfamily)